MTKNCFENSRQDPSINQIGIAIIEVIFHGNAYWVPVSSKFLLMAHKKMLEVWLH